MRMFTGKKLPFHLLALLVLMLRLPMTDAILGYFPFGSPGKCYSMPASFNDCLFSARTSFLHCLRKHQMIQPLCINYSCLSPEEARHIGLQGLRDLVSNTLLSENQLRALDHSLIFIVCQEPSEEVLRMMGFIEELLVSNQIPRTCSYAESTGYAPMGLHKRRIKLNRDRKGPCAPDWVSLKAATATSPATVISSPTSVTVPNPASGTAPIDIFNFDAAGASGASKECLTARAAADRASRNPKPRKQRQTITEGQFSQDFACEFSAFAASPQQSSSSVSAKKSMTRTKSQVFDLGAAAAAAPEVTVQKSASPFE